MLCTALCIWSTLHGQQAMQHVSLQLHAVAAAAAHAVQPLSQPAGGLLQLLVTSQVQSSEQDVLAVR